jgi:hypothetical protein
VQYESRRSYQTTDEPATRLVVTAQEQENRKQQQQGHQKARSRL